MHVRIFPPLVFIHLFFPLFFIIDLVFPLCLLPVWHLVGASGPSHDDFSTCPSPLSHPPLSRPIPSLLLTILGDLHCKLSSLPHFRSRTSTFFFLSSFIQPASERESDQHCRIFLPPPSEAPSRHRRYPEDPFQHRRRVVSPSFFFFSFSPLLLAGTGVAPRLLTRGNVSSSAGERFVTTGR